MEAATKTRFTHFFIKFNVQELARIDEEGQQLQCTSREEALRKIVGAFGKKLGVEVPLGPLPELKPYVSPADTPRKQYHRTLDAHKSVALKLPVGSGEEWIRQLRKATGEHSIYKIVKQAVRESKQ